MTTGVDWVEDHRDPDSLASRLLGCFATGAQAGDQSRALLRSVRPGVPPGTRFGYCTADSQVLDWVRERATGLSYADDVARLWQALGCTRDAYVAVDGTGVALAGGALAATARDWARVAHLAVDGCSDRGRAAARRRLGRGRRPADVPVPRRRPAAQQHHHARRLRLPLVADGRRGPPGDRRREPRPVRVRRPAYRRRRGEDLAVALRRLPGRPPGARPQLPRPARPAGCRRHPSAERRRSTPREPQRHDHLRADRRRRHRRPLRARAGDPGADRRVGHRRGARGRHDRAHPRPRPRDRQGLARGGALPRGRRADPGLRRRRHHQHHRRHGRRPRARPARTHDVPWRAPTWSAASTGCPHVEELLPDICTLDCGSLNFGEGSLVYVSTPDMLREGAKKIQELGVRAEMEIFDTGHLWFANQLVEEGLIDAPAMYQLCMGIPYGAPADPLTLAAMVNQLPEGAVWASFALGPMQMPWVAQSVLLGGHVRVGLEDNLYLSKGVKATNAQLVERARTIVESMGAKVATPDEGREILALKAAMSRCGRPRGRPDRHLRRRRRDRRRLGRLLPGPRLPRGGLGPGRGRRGRGCGTWSARRGRRSPSSGLAEGAEPGQPGRRARPGDGLRPGRLRPGERAGGPRAQAHAAGRHRRRHAGGRRDLVVDLGLRR